MDEIVQLCSVDHSNCHSNCHSPLKMTLARVVRQLRRTQSRPLAQSIAPARLVAFHPAPSSPASTRILHSRQFTSSPARSGGHAPPRGNYKVLTAADVAHFRSILSSPSSIITTIASPAGEWTAATQDDLVGYNQDWMQKYTGSSPILLKPKTTEEVSAIMKYCYEERIAVVPQGGNTGLVGGSTPVYDELILSTEAMREIRGFDEVSGMSKGSAA